MRRRENQDVLAGHAAQCIGLPGPGGGSPTPSPSIVVRRVHQIHSCVAITSSEKYKHNKMKKIIYLNPVAQSQYYTISGPFPPPFIFVPHPLISVGQVRPIGWAGSRALRLE